jgi:short-subunit dehydrogenase
MRPHFWRIMQRVAIATGAAGGIGRELVLGLLGKELKVAAIDRTAQGLAELAQAVQACADEA